MPEPSTLTIVLKANDRFSAEMSRAVDKLVRLVNALNNNAEFMHHARHHLPEDPARSAMHAAYDVRRRARRRRNRR